MDVHLSCSMGLFPHSLRVKKHFILFLPGPQQSATANHDRVDVGNDRSSIKELLIFNPSAFYLYTETRCLSVRQLGGHNTIAADKNGCQQQNIFFFVGVNGGVAFDFQCPPGPHWEYLLVGELSRKTWFLW